MFNLILFIAFILNFVLAHLIGNNGKYRKIGYGTSFFVSFLLSPIIGLLLVISSKSLSDDELKILEDKENAIKKTSMLGNILFYVFMTVILSISAIMIYHMY